MIKKMSHVSIYVLDQDSAYDIYATYEELKSKGVLFSKAPKEEFYGVEAIFKDDSGNWFSLGQKK